MVQRRAKDRQVGVELRDALKKFMRDQHLTPSGWSKLAGVPESALRNFLAERSHTLTHLTLMALAGAVQVPLAALSAGREDWGRTETVDVCVAVNATERPGEWMSLSDAEQFSIRIPSEARYKQEVKFGAYLEDESASALWAKGSILICADYAWTDVDDTSLEIKPGDLFFVIERTTRLEKSNNMMATFVKATVRKLLQDDAESYLITCSNNPRFLHNLRLPYSIVGKTITKPIKITVDSEIVLSGKVLASFRTEEGRNEAS